MPAVGTVTVVPKRLSATDHKRILADIRNQLPVAEYLSVLHTLALTGQMPCYDPPKAPNLPPTPNGQFTAPDPYLQHKTLTYLVDKAFAPLEKPAAAKAAEQAGQQDDERLLTEVGDARNLTVGELLRRLTHKRLDLQNDAPPEHHEAP
jgi:hypothetical protein